MTAYQIRSFSGCLKAVNEKIGPNGLVPPLLIFCTLPNFPCVSKFSPKQAERFEVHKIARTEMETVVEESTIQKTLQSKLPPATK